MREWYNGSIVAFQAIDPGSTPGSRTFYVTSSSSSEMILVNWSAVAVSQSRQDNDNNNNNNNNNLLFLSTPFIILQIHKGVSRVIFTNFLNANPLTRLHPHAVRRKVIIISQ